MKVKKVKRFTYEGLGFPVVLVNVNLVEKRGVWTPAIDYNKFQKQVLIALSHKTAALTGNEIHFIRTYFDMTLEGFGEQFGLTHVAILNWEKSGDKSAKINPTTELCIRLMILDKLKMNNQVFRDTFREFDVQEFAKQQKMGALKAVRPVTLLSSSFSKPLRTSL